MLKVMLSPTAMSLLQSLLQDKHKHQGSISGGSVEHQEIIYNVVLCLAMALNDSGLEDEIIALPETRIYKEGTTEFKEPDVIVIGNNKLVYFVFEIQHTKIDNYVQNRFKQLKNGTIRFDTEHKDNILIMYNNSDRKEKAKYVYYFKDSTRAYDKNELNQIKFCIKKGDKSLELTAYDIVSDESMRHSRRILSKTHERINELSNRINELSNRINELDAKLDAKMDEQYKKLLEAINSIKGVNNIGSVDDPYDDDYDEDVNGYKHKDLYGSDEDIL